MSQANQITSEIHEVYDDRSSTRSKVTVEISVLEDGDWIGDFTATFTRQRLSGDMRYVADWSDTRSGNGLYVDEEPPFWPVQEVATKLNDRFELQEFVALNTGPNDI